MNQHHQQLSPQIKLEDNNQQNYIQKLTGNQFHPQASIFNKIAYQPQSIQYQNTISNISPWMKRMIIKQQHYLDYPVDYYPIENLKHIDLYHLRNSTQNNQDIIRQNQLIFGRNQEQMRYQSYLRNYSFLPESYKLFYSQFNQLNKLNLHQQESEDVTVKVEQESYLSLSQNKKTKQQQKVSKNETKNIPKNYGKAMINFIIERSDWIKLRFGSQIHNSLIQQLKNRKLRINSIIHLKQLWTNSKFSPEFRILSNLFLRKHGFAYIFNSRVSNYSTHIKYRYKIQQALKSPQSFKSIKEY